MFNKMSLYRVKKGFVYLRYFGPKEFLIRLKERIRIQKIDYEKWYENHRRTEEELESQRQEVFAYAPLISIVVPVYQAPEEFLRQMILSVCRQTYKNWELCMTVSDEERHRMEEILEEDEFKEKAIHLIGISENRGISENTNAAIKEATGTYIGFLDQDDLLAPDALYEMVKKLNEYPEVGLLYSDEDKDLVFRCVEKTIMAHVPRILYHWRVHQVSTADNPISKTYAFEAGQRAIEAHLLRCGEHAEVLPELDRGFYRVRYKMQGNPKISILIPNKDHIKDLEKCLQSISRSDYKNYEIIIIENNSEKAETFAYYKTIESDRIRILKWEGSFNYSAINNYAVSETDGEYLVLLNNDTEVIGKDWLGEMLANCQRKEVGIVGAKLYYPNGQVQHAGVIVGIRGIAGNMFRGLPKGYSGYMHKASTQQDLSAVTAACMMVKRSVYEEVGGFEEQLAVAFNDVDFCLKVRRCGYLVVYDPYVKLYHYESRSRGAEDNEEKIRRYQCEIDYVRRTWSEIMEKGDPMYNPNLTLVKCDYSLREKENG